MLEYWNIGMREYKTGGWNDGIVEYWNLVKPVRSNIPFFQCSNLPMFQRSIVPMFQLMLSSAAC